MKLHRIWGVILRYNYLFKHSLDRQVDAFYWPTVDLVLWGITSTYLASQSKGIPFAVLMVVSGIVLWIILWRGQYEFTVNILEDMWNKNLVNMFSSPLKLSEWVAAFVTLGIVKAIISTSFAGLMAFLLYKTNLFQYGFKLLPFLFLLLMTGWWMGLLVGGLIIRFGGKVQNFVKEYKDKYHTDANYIAFSGANYDLVNLFAAGVKQVGYDGTKLSSWTRTIKDYDGIIGKIAIEQTGENASSYTPGVVKNGAFQANQQ